MVSVVMFNEPHVVLTSVEIKTKTEPSRAMCAPNQNIREGNLFNRMNQSDNYFDIFEFYQDSNFVRL
jgi:hypothetical protein